MTSYWMMVGTVANWRLAAELGVWAAARVGKLWQDVKKGDRIIAYAARGVSAFYGVFRVASDSYYDDALRLFGLDPRKYPYRVSISEELIPEKPVSIRPLLNELDFIKNKEKWGIYFQRTVRKIGQDDFNKILSYMKAAGQFKTDK